MSTSRDGRIRKIWEVEGLERRGGRGRGRGEGVRKEKGGGGGGVRKEKGRELKMGEILYRFAVSAGVFAGKIIIIKTKKKS